MTHTKLFSVETTSFRPNRLAFENAPEVSRGCDAKVQVPPDTQMTREQWERMRAIEDNAKKACEGLANEVVNKVQYHPEVEALLKKYPNLISETSRMMPKKKNNVIHITHTSLGRQGTYWFKYEPDSNSWKNGHLGHDLPHQDLLKMLDKMSRSDSPAVVQLLRDFPNFVEKETMGERRDLADEVNIKINGQSLPFSYDKDTDQWVSRGYKPLSTKDFRSALKN